MSRPVTTEALAARLEAIERLLATVARETLPLPRDIIPPAGRRELREYDKHALGGNVLSLDVGARPRRRRNHGKAEITWDAGVE
jgi:hypothetical protein